MTTSLPFYPWRNTDDSIELFIRLTPKSAHNRIQGLFYDSTGKAFLKIAVTSPPIDGLANKALIDFLAKTLSCPKSSITLTKGHTDRYKTLLITSMSVPFLQKTLLP
ncbi:MAG: DUF167 domain-containing protein [Alphaproteobacteria bacterium]|nr:DUF167 domain-containing protein [Alphaproteobacteria bacterium]